MMAECWYWQRATQGRFPHALLASRGVRADRRDRGRPRALPIPVQRGHDDPPGQPWWNTWPVFPLPRLTDVLQSGDHLVSVWPPGETPVESASQCDGTAGLRFPPRSPASPGSPTRATRRVLLARRRRSPRFLPIRRQLPSTA